MTTSTLMFWSLQLTAVAVAWLLRRRNWFGAGLGVCGAVMAAIALWPKYSADEVAGLRAAAYAYLVLVIILTGWLAWKSARGAAASAADDGARGSSGGAAVVRKLPIALVYGYIAVIGSVALVRLLAS